MKFGDSESEMFERFPESLHNQLRVLANLEGRSINQFLADDAAEKVAASMTEQYLEERAGRGSREKFRAVLARIPDVAPLPEDSI